jgi:hypothetical protein
MDATRKYILQHPETFLTIEGERMVLLSPFYKVSILLTTTPLRFTILPEAIK